MVQGPTGQAPVESVKTPKWYVLWHDGFRGPGRTRKEKRRMLKLMARAARKGRRG